LEADVKVVTNFQVNGEVSIVCQSGTRTPKQRASKGSTSMHWYWSDGFKSDLPPAAALAGVIDWTRTARFFREERDDFFLGFLVETARAILFANAAFFAIFEDLRGIATENQRDYVG
jgi:hypothetical protein